MLLTLVFATTLMSCATDPVQWGPDPTPLAERANVVADPGSTFRLAPGQLAAVGDILVGFRGIRTDSRCAADVQCVWQGDAEAVIGTAPERGRWTWTTLHIGVEPRTVDTDAFEIRLRALEPEPRSSVRIPPEDYRVVLEVVRQ